MRRLALVIALFCALTCEAKVNIVVFLSDDHGALDSEVYGSKFARTPNMVRLARDGITLTRAFVTSPSCAPSRASLLTGLMPARHGAEANHARPHGNIKKLPAYLKELGYEVVAFGKVSHYKHTADYGFDHFAHDTFHEHAAIPAALDWLKSRKSDKPLCLFVGSNWPHVPWPQFTNSAPPEALPARQIATPEILRARAAYLAAVEKMDTELGQVYDAARASFGTNLFFLHTSDHGAQFPFGKWNLYDAGIRATFLATWPGVIPANSGSDALVNWTDILPTLVEAAEAKPPANIDGRSLLPLLKGQTQAHRDVIFATHSADGAMNIYPMRALRTDRWKYIRNLHPEYRFTTHIDLGHKNETAPARWGAYWESWTAAASTNAIANQILRAYHQRPAEELYDLSTDPHEERNLAANPEHTDRLREFRARLETWITEQNDRGLTIGKPKLLEEKLK